MREFVEMVRQFHVKHGFPVGIAPGEDPKTDLVRVHLIAEEGVAELALALAERDMVLIADALADLAYVLFGAAVTYGVPLQEVFEEVHRSNMTKAVRRPGDTRLRDKGESYRPADVRRALAEGVLARWRREIGPGFHADNDAADYEPPLAEPAQYDRDTALARNVLGDEVYAVSPPAGDGGEGRADPDPAGMYQEFVADRGDDKIAARLTEVFVKERSHFMAWLATDRRGRRFWTVPVVRNDPRDAMEARGACQAKIDRYRARDSWAVTTIKDDLDDLCGRDPLLLLLCEHDGTVRYALDYHPDLVFAHDNDGSAGRAAHGVRGLQYLVRPPSLAENAGYAGRVYDTGLRPPWEREDDQC